MNKKLCSQIKSKTEQIRFREQFTTTHNYHHQIVGDKHETSNVFRRTEHKKKSERKKKTNSTRLVIGFLMFFSSSRMIMCVDIVLVPVNIESELNPLLV